MIATKQKMISLETVVEPIFDMKSIPSFFQNFNEAQIYHTPSYMRFLSSVCPQAELSYITVKENDNIIGIMPIAVHTDASYGTVINSLPFFGSHGGPIVKSGKNKQIILSSMIDCIESTYPHLSCCTIIENLFSPLSEEEMKNRNYRVIDDRIGQCSFLPANQSNLEDALMGMLHMKTRNAVRKGLQLNQDVQRRYDRESLQWLQQIHESSMKIIGGKHKSLYTFQKLIDHFPLESHSGLYTGTVNEMPVSGLLLLFHEDTVEYFTPVVAEEYKDKQALSALIFQVMLEMVRAGYKKWNWGGTWKSQEGVYRFKNRWNAKDFPYRYFGRVYNPNFMSHPVAEITQSFPYFYLYKY